LDYYVNGRPTDSQVVEGDGGHPTEFPVKAHGRVTVEIRGFATREDGETQVARQLQYFNAEIELAKHSEA
jgi:hypothetical protein